MRLPDDVWKKAAAPGLSALLVACVGGGSSQAEFASASDAVQSVAAGPEADWPQVLGDPFTVDGTLYTPEDVYSYDAVGLAALDEEGGTAISVAHKTLPLPSYVELTSLETGRTVLARVERRGPMTSSRIVALSPGAQTQLGVGEGAPLRVRRVNPQEFERAQLRNGGVVPPRLDTPEPLLAVLRDELPQAGAASLAAATGAALASAGNPEPPARTAAVRSSPAPTPASMSKSFDAAFAQRDANTAYPLPPLEKPAAMPAPPPVAVAPSRQVQGYSLPGTQTAAAKPLVAPAPPKKAETSAPAAKHDGDGKFVVQAAAFSSKASAQALAERLDGGFVMPAGKYFRVRTGPYATRGQAEAALAKVRAAGYSDARVFSAG